MTVSRTSVLYKKKIKNVAVVFRRATPAASALAAELVIWLRARKVKSFSHPAQSIAGAPKLKNPKLMDLIIVLGGDGTYLEAVRMLGEERVPLLGVNMGSLGFLTVTRAQDLFPMVELALDGQLEVKRRSMLSVELRSGQKSMGTFTCLNDLVIERGPLSQLVNFTMTVDRLPIAAIKADGLIVATPTGSTAYNLAAGGPILHPEVDALVVTPICPHSLTSRPFIFPDARTIQFSILSVGKKAVLTVDGVKKAKIGPHDEVWVDRHPADHLFLRKPGHNFFSLLKEKLKFGERA